MAKKMKKSQELSELQHRQEQHLPLEKIEIPEEDVSENQAFELEIDMETKEIIFVQHFREKWGDIIDDDIEYPMSVEEAKAFVMTLIKMIEEVEKIGKEEVKQEEVEVKEDESLP